MNATYTKNKKMAVEFRLNALDRHCAANRETPLRHPPGGHKGVVYRGDDFEVEIYYDIEYEPAQRGGWDEPSWGESATAYGAYFRRANGLWYSIELTESEANELGEEYLSDCGGSGPDQDDDDRYCDDDYDRAQTMWEKARGF